MSSARRAPHGLNGIDVTCAAVDEVRGASQPNSSWPSRHHACPRWNAGARERARNGTWQRARRLLRACIVAAKPTKIATLRATSSRGLPDYLAILTTPSVAATSRRLHHRLGLLVH